ncbi:MAG: benzoate-CoA ligase family protein [Rhodospirillales bacterium]|nr:benzoate-CoA ligase family protein [Rhodospirillales bacterium]
MTVLRVTQDGAKLNATEAILGPNLDAGRGDFTAIAFGESKITYNELDGLVNRFGNAMKATGLEVENRVFFMMKDTPNLVAAYLGAMKVGAVSIAYNVRASEKEMLYALSDSRAKILFIDAEFLGTYRKIALKLPRSIKVVVEGAASGEFDNIQSFLEGQSSSLTAEDTSADDMAFWIYTSGTTGNPKATVHLQHDVLLGQLHLIENLGVVPGQKVFASSKMFFAYALGHILMGGLSAGAEIILYDGWPDANSIGRIIDKHQPDVVFSVPTFYRNMLREGVAELESFKQVRHYISAGEKLPTQLFTKWQETTGVTILEGIGSSETTHLFIASKPDAVREGSCGKVNSWAKFMLKDDEGNEITEPNTPGIGWALLESNCDRYWNRQAKSQEVISEGWYCTGDMFSFDEDGFFYHHGRGDDMLKISGQWVSPTEIEDVVLKVPNVDDCTILGQANEDGLVRLALYVVSQKENGEQEALSETIKASVTEQLSIYKCPRNIHYISEIPRTATGKVQRYQLRENHPT